MKAIVERPSEVASRKLFDSVKLMDERGLAEGLAKKRQGESGERSTQMPLMHVPVWNCEPSRGTSKANQPRR
jgi:hypothetical protein